MHIATTLSLTTPAPKGFSRHACARMQQWAIAPAVVDLLLSFGSVMRSGPADVYLLDHESRARLRDHLGDATYRQIESRLNCWAVVGDDGTILSVGHRTRRRRR
jgi:hypothetical protein